MCVCVCVWGVGGWKGGGGEGVERGGWREEGIKYGPKFGKENME